VERKTGLSGQFEFRALRGDRFDSVQPEFGFDGNFGGLGLHPQDAKEL